METPEVEMFPHCKECIDSSKPAVYIMGKIFTNYTICRRVNISKIRVLKKWESKWSN